jgi:acyl phosphate:glycerol-3-phosphate acyltransferase
MRTALQIAAASYLLGSIPFGYLLVRIFRGEDVRLTGSGNIGATNVSRKSPALGVATLFLDALKGSTAVALAAGFGPMDAPKPYGLMSLAALLAVVGHMFQIWLKFRGGKGVATSLGSFLMIAPKAVLLAAGIFFVVVLLFRYISMGSILSVAAFPVLVWLLREYGNSWTALAFMSMASLLIVAKHHANIRRLLAGTENRFGSKPVARAEKR